MMRQKYSIYYNAVFFSFEFVPVNTGNVTTDTLFAH